MKRGGKQIAIVAVQGFIRGGVGFVTFAASRFAMSSMRYERSVLAAAAEANIFWVIQDAVRARGAIESGGC